MRALLSNRKVQVLLNGGLGLGLLAVAFFSAKHFIRGGWPLHDADPILVGAAAFLFLIAYAFKAWGWQRLFNEHERPGADALAFAGGAACVGGIAMPGRVDDAIRIACVRRFPGTRASLFGDSVGRPSCRTPASRMSGWTRPCGTCATPARTGRCLATETKGAKT